MAVKIPPPEAFAMSVLRRVGVPRPSDMTDFARDIGLRVTEVESRGFDGALIRIPYKPRGVVGVRSGIRELGRKRFTIAHEIGHYILPGHGTFKSVCKDEQIDSLNGGGGNQEAAANRFASELLLPSEQIVPIIKANSVDIKTARAISNDFQTSLTAAARKCVALSQGSCAFVISVDGVVKHWMSSKSWRFRMPVGCTLGAGTVARRLAEGRGKRHETMEISPYAWVMAGNVAPDNSLIEDSIRLPNYNTVLSILTVLGP